MIDYNDLINRIESMQDLPVSEEMLGAYCEGLLSPVDATAIDSCIANDAEFGDLVDSMDNSLIVEETYSFDDSIGGVDDIELPNVPNSKKTYFPIGGIILKIAENIGKVAAAFSPIVTACGCMVDSIPNETGKIHNIDSGDISDKDLNGEGMTNKSNGSA